MSKDGQNNFAEPILC